MIEYIETKTDQGIPVRVEVEPSIKSGAGFGQKTGGGEVTGEAAKDSYNQTMHTIHAFVNGIIGTLQNLDASPTSASVDFAIKIDAEAGAMVAKSMGESHFKISLSWKQIEADDDKKSDDEDEADDEDKSED